MRRVATACLLAVAMTVLAPAPASAQAVDTTQLSLSGFSGAFPTPTVAQVDAGIVPAGSQLTFTITNLFKKNLVTATIYIAASAATIGGTKSSGDVQWRLSPSGTFVGLTTTNALVGTYNVPQTIGASVSGSLDLQMLVRWTDPPATYSGTNIIITMTVP